MMPKIAELIEGYFCRRKKVRVLYLILSANLVAGFKFKFLMRYSHHSYHFQNTNSRYHCPIDQTVCISGDPTMFLVLYWSLLIFRRLLLVREEHTFAIYLSSSPCPSNTWPWFPWGQIVSWGVWWWRICDLWMEWGALLRFCYKNSSAALICGSMRMRELVRARTICTALRYIL